MKMMLMWRTGRELHRRLVTAARPLLVGRQPKCDLVIPDDTVAAEHALLYATATHFYLQNLSRTAPIVLAGQRIITHGQTAELHAGDTFCLGQVAVAVMALTGPVTRQVRCARCARLLPASLADCTWCGASLAGALLVMSGKDESDR
jgi:predicted component of type VI protein secretion system